MAQISIDNGNTFYTAREFFEVLRAEAEEQDDAGLVNLVYFMVAFYLDTELCNLIDFEFDYESAEEFLELYLSASKHDVVIG